MTAALVVAYGARPAEPREEMEEMLTMRPSPRSSMRFPAAWSAENTPCRFTSTTADHSSHVRSSIPR